VDYEAQARSEFDRLDVSRILYNPEGEEVATGRKRHFPIAIGLQFNISDLI
jgi:hypothetical protein